MDHPNHAAAAPRGRAPSAASWPDLACSSPPPSFPLLIGAVLDNLIHTLRCCCSSGS